MTNSEDSRSGGAMDRRTFLEGAAGVAGVATVGAGTGAPAAAQSAFDGWFENVSNYDGVVDETGSSEVTIEVGASGNNGNFAFGPAAIRVDPGTTIVWKWTGKGGSHNVVAEDGSFESQTSGSQDHTFEHTFEEAGLTKYACTPHEGMGMKGAVAVGSAAAPDAKSVQPAGGAGGSGESDLDRNLTLGFAAALLVALLGLPVAEMRKRKE